MKENVYVTFPSLVFFSHFLHQPAHIPCNLLVCDLSVDLCAGNGRMSHHLCNTLYQNGIVRKTYTLFRIIPGKEWRKAKIRLISPLIEIIN